MPRVRTTACARCRLAPIGLATILLIISGAFRWTLAAAQQIQGAPPNTDLFASSSWSDVESGVQIRLAEAWAATERAQRDGFFPLALQIRNVADTPLPVDQDRLTFEIEYEIDGKWYGFESAGATGDASRGTVPGLTLRRDAVTPMFTVIDLVQRSRYLSLYALPTTATSERLVLTPGRHSIRARFRPTAFGADRNGSKPSGAVSIVVPRITLSASSAAASAPLLRQLRAFQFPAVPSNSRSVAEEALKRPTPIALTKTPRLADYESLQLLDPIGFYDLVLPRAAGDPDPTLPVQAVQLEYLVVANGEGVGSIAVRDSQPGRLNTYSHQEPAPIVKALVQLAGMVPVRSGGYEPRLLRVLGYRGLSYIHVLWLHSSAGRSDLFYRYESPEQRSLSRVQVERLYTRDDFLKAGRERPLAPVHDEAWAIGIATACAQEDASGARALLFANGTAQYGVNDRGDAVVWFVYFPGRQPQRKPSGAAFTVDEASGKCAPVYLE